MKKLLFFVAIAACAFACKPAEEEVPVVEVTMSSFGFTAEKNAVLKSDVTVENPSSAISVTLPYGTDEEALKSLVPTFTVTEGAAVTVGEEEIESGVTALDFTYPVEILVTVNEKSNALYTVTVTVGEPAKWVKKAESSVEFTSEPAMTLSPDGKNLYIFGYDKEGSHPVMLAYDGAALTQIGETGTEAAQHIASGCSPDGVPYGAFYDKTSKQVKVYAYKNGKAEAVGDASAILQTAGNAVGTSTIVPIAENNIYLFLMSNKANAATGLVKKGLNVCHYDGKEWSQFGTLPDWAGSVTYDTRVKWIGGVPYIFVLDYTKAEFYIYKYADNAWKTVCAAVHPLKTDNETPITTASFRYGAMNFDVASNGDVYLIAGANYAGEDKEIGVVKYDIDKKTTTIVGGVMSGVLSENCRYLSMALDDNDVPYVVYGNTFTEGAPSYVRYINSKTKLWSEPVAVEANQTSGIDIQFGADGAGYIVYQDATTYKYVICTNIAE